MASRHKWVKLRIHVYICRVCGTGKVNAEEHGSWFTTYHKPTGESVVSRHTPPCDVGPKTTKYLERYAAEIAQAAQQKPV